MACNAPPNLDSHGANLALATTDPDTGILSGGCVWNGQPGASTHHGVFEEGDVGAGRDAVATVGPTEVEERVGGQLAGTVEGEVPAAGCGVECCEVGGGAGEEGLLGRGDVVGGWFGI